MLKVKSITAGFGRLAVLRNVTLHVKRGEIVALVGANGAGKTTLLNVISGLHKPASGLVVFGEKELNGAAPEEVVRRGLVQVPEERQIFPSLTVLENLELGAFVLPSARRKAGLRANLERAFSLFPVLKDRGSQRAGTLSGGEQQMLSMGRALMAEPECFLMDEPSLGLAPLIVDEIFTVIEGLKSEGKTVLLVEQNARLAFEVADRAYVIETGRIMLSGTPERLLDNDEVVRSFLGREYREKWEK